MSDETSTPGTSGTPQAPSSNAGPGDRLRAAGVDASAGTEKRGRGRPRKDSGQAPAPKPAPSVKPSKAPEFVYSKTGKAFRCLGNIAALKTNCSIWLLAPEEEKELGESVGDLLLELGLSDTMAAKVAFAVGTVIAIGGTKTIQYLTWRNAQTVQQVVDTPSVPPVVEKPTTDAGPSVIPEARPGVI